MRFTSINTSIIVGDLPLDEQLALAASHGFTEVELWWPFETPNPTDDQVNGFLRTVEASGLALIGLNLYEGGMAEGNRGIACWPGFEQQMRETVAVAKRIGLATGCRMFNVLNGTILPGVDRAEQDALAASNTAYAAQELATIGGTVTIEQLSHIPGYGLRTAADVLGAIERAVAVNGADNIRMQVDLFHMYNVGDDVPTFFDEHWDVIGHVQVADEPGRGGPGTGTRPVIEHLERLRANGYDGRFTLEYSWAGPDGDPFGWMR